VGFSSVLVLVEELGAFLSEYMEELPFLMKYHTLWAWKNATIKHFHANGLEKETCKSQPVKEQQFIFPWRSSLERECLIRKLSLFN